MGHLLIDERPLVILPSLAAKIGLNQAVFIQQLHYLTQFSPNGVEDEGLRWVKCSIPQWAKSYFPFWSAKTVERIIAELKDSGYIFVKQDIGGRSSERTNWYSMDSHSPVWGDDTDKMTCPSRQNDVGNHVKMTRCYKEEKDLRRDNTRKTLTRSSRVEGDGSAKTESSVGNDIRHSQIVKLYQQLYSEKNHCPVSEVPWTGREAKQLSRILEGAPNYPADVFLACIRNRFESDVNYADHPRFWMLNGRLSSYKNGPVDAYGKTKGMDVSPKDEQRSMRSAGRSADDFLRDLKGGN